MTVTCILEYLQPFVEQIPLLTRSIIAMIVTLIYLLYLCVELRLSAEKQRKEWLKGREHLTTEFRQSLFGSASYAVYYPRYIDIKISERYQNNK